MASSNSNKTGKDDKHMNKKPEPIIYLPEFADKLQKKANQIYIPPPPLTNPEHRYVSEVDFFRLLK
jgi:hypothetical protein